MKVGAVHVRDIATGGDPLHAYLRAMLPLTGGPQALHTRIHHDDGCPCLRGLPMPACTCEIVRLVTKRLG